ncbi:MAG: alpha-mannosidase [Clostridiaceae bacterium]|nr:alpha-mannosidase [Clostridiaceae bacterium]
MPYPFKEIKPKLSNTLELISKSIFTPIATLQAEMWKTKEPVPFDQRLTGEYSKVAIGDSWGELWDCAWFHFTGTVPETAKGANVVALIDLSGEACIFDETGCPVQGLTTVTSEFDYTHGRPGKRVVEITSCACGGEVIDIWADAGCNDLFGKYQDHGTLKQAHIAICNPNMRMLYYDFEVLYTLLNNLPENSARAVSIMHSLNEASLVLNEFTDKEAALAREILAPALNKKGGDPSLSVSAIGHAHIDLAWLWPIRETKRKAVRTFSTALMMMDKYPDYIFGASQAQLYAWVKEEYPALYEKIKEKIKQGRWEVQGAMWVEADTNVSGGEALVRQILYGKRFFWNEFQKDMKVLWLPDVFGYTGSLPQLLKKSGVDYFMTIKLSWSVHNKFPHHTFIWTGIDGSEVLAHMPPEGTYNSAASPTSIKKAEYEYLDNGIAPECLLLFGIGDGGGGPGEEHLERLVREKNLDGLPPVTQEHSIDFFNRINKYRSKLKSWRGELYLERHQGTYTTQARNKKYNRKLEIILRELEFVSMLASLLKGYKYPAQEIETIWKEVLLYQFHDILPGSSIKRVYDESLERYKILEEEVSVLLSKAYEALGVTCPTVFNTLSWNRCEWIKHNDQWFKVMVPSMGYSPLVSKSDNSTLTMKAETNLLENDKLKVTFNEDGSIKSIFDKENGREAIAPGAAANKLAVYYDDGDAWDISILYPQRPAGSFVLESTEATVDGPKAELVQTYSYGSSRIEQRISLTHGSRRLDFATKVDWQENSKMLRVSFPVNVSALDATCGIQFGSIKRPVFPNTSFDMAKNEVCAHKWVDMSEPGYGVALLNDCKYGHYVHENVLDLNLLRSTDYPGINADRGLHEFTYSLYPHAGDHIAGNVVREAYELNMPLRVVLPQADTQIQQDSVSLVEVDRKNIIVETVKKAEDSDSVIIRLYECDGMSTTANLKFGIAPKKIVPVDLMENEIGEAEEYSNSASLSFKPFEILTLKLTF